MERVSRGISSLLPDAVQTFLTEHNGEAAFAIIALGLCQAAYFSEDLRSGLRAVPPGQGEAARALGHSYIRAMRYVLMPQALRNALPALIELLRIASGEQSICLVAAKVLYFGVGGGIAEFVAALEQEARGKSWKADARTVWERNTGVGRKILQIEWS